MSRCHKSAPRAIDPQAAFDYFPATASKKGLPVSLTTGVSPDRRVNPFVRVIYKRRAGLVQSAVRPARNTTGIKMTTSSAWMTEKPTAVLVLADGTTIFGKGIGATGRVHGGEDDENMVF